MIENIQHFKFRKKSSKKTTTFLRDSKSIKNNRNYLTIKEKEKQYSQLFIKILNSNKSSLEKNGHKKGKNIHEHQRNIIKKISLFSNEELKYKKVFNTQFNKQAINGTELNNTTSEKNIIKSKIIYLKNNNKTIKKQNILRNISETKEANNTKVNSLLLSENQKQSNTFQSIYNKEKEKVKETFNKMEKNNTEQNIKKGLFLKKQNEENKKYNKLDSKNKNILKPSYLKEKFSKKKSKLKVDILNDKNEKTIENKKNEQLNYILIKKFPPTRYELKNTKASPNVSKILNKNHTYLVENENFGRKAIKESIYIRDSYRNINNKKKQIFNKMKSNTKCIFTDISQSLPKIKISYNNTTDMNTTKSSGIKDYSSTFELRKKEVNKINLNSTFIKDKILLSNKSLDIKKLKSSNFLKYQKIPKDKINNKKDKFNKKQIIRINIRDKFYNTKNEQFNGNNPINLNCPDNESSFNDKESFNTKYLKSNSLFKNKYFTKKNIQSFSLERNLKKRHETVRNNIDNIGKKLLILVNEFHNGSNNDDEKTFTIHSRKLIDRIRTFKKLNNI